MADVVPFVRRSGCDCDALWDTSDQAMADRFGARARQLLRDGGDVRQAARLAASYAARVLLAQSLPDAIDAHLSALGLVYVGQSEIVQ